MDGGLYLIDILIFAMIAAFLVFRLRSVLGRRTGNERQRPNPFAGAQQQGGANSGDARPADNVVSLPERGERDRSREAAEPASGAGQPGSLAAGITQIKIADPSFEESAFVQGAQIAFGMIVEAFARGDTATLRPLLSDELYDEFSSAIRSRLAAGHTLETKIERIASLNLLEARMDGRTALVTAKIVSRQINATRDEQGHVIEGDAETPAEVTDIWTFARNTRSKDPNWVLVETRTPN